jgi:hypothetical protein
MLLGKMLARVCMGLIDWPAIRCWKGLSLAYVQQMALQKLGGSSTSVGARED